MLEKLSGVYRILFKTMATLIALIMLTCSNNVCVKAERGDLSVLTASIPSLECNGRTYMMRSRLTSVLLLGIDKDSQEESSYRQGGQADFLMLLVIDDNAKTVTPIEINRDTMAEIVVLSVLGEEIGTRRGQIALSYAFGDGEIISCELAKQAVSRLMLDTPIDEVAALNMDGIAVLNDLIGGVEVTLEEDFSIYDTSMTVGTTLRLRGEQAAYYLRQRYDVGDQSNASRLARQRNYLLSAKAPLIEKIRTSKSFTSTLFEQLEPYMITDMSRGKMINLANKVASYEVHPIAQIDGETYVGSQGFIEFEVDTNCLWTIVVDAFYE